MNFSLVSLIDFAALTQGLLLGIILIVSSKKNKPSLVLGIFLILYTLDLVDSLLDDFGILQEYPQLLFIHMKFFLLTPVLFYVYAKNILDQFRFKKEFWLFIPGILEFIFFGIIFFLPVAQKQDIAKYDTIHKLYYILVIASIISYILFSVLVIRLININKLKVLNYYSNSQGRLLVWVRFMAYYLIIISVPALIALIWWKEGSSGFFIYNIYSILNVIFIFWVGLFGFQQQKIFDRSAINIINPPIKNDSIAKPDKGKDLVNLEKIKLYVQQKEHFSNPKLNLLIVSHNTSISQRNVSRLINNYLDINFNQFINQYRIDEAKQLLLDKNYQHYNILGISDIVGFNSKTSFYNSFKQIVGMTPQQYRNSHISFSE